MSRAVFHRTKFTHHAIFDECFLMLHNTLAVSCQLQLQMASSAGP
jgi:hypothetical protein